MRIGVLAFAVLVTRPAVAEQVERITLIVGETVERDVGLAMGALCDDLKIVRAEMRNKSPDTNAFVVTGLEPGTTLCRAGSVNVSFRSYLFEITVVAPPPGP